MLSAAGFLLSCQASALRQADRVALLQALQWIDRIVLLRRANLRLKNPQEVYKYDSDVYKYDSETRETGRRGSVQREITDGTRCTATTSEISCAT